MKPKYIISLSIKRESDGKEANIQFDEDGIAEVLGKNGLSYGQFRLSEENFLTADSIVPEGTFDQCLKYCTIDEGKSLAYCLAICAAAAP